jgi:hypothetical protein
MWRYALLFLALLSPANAGVYARNSTADINNKVDIRVYDEIVGPHIVGEVSATLTIPSRSLRQYHLIYVWSTGSEHGFAVMPAALPVPVPVGIPDGAAWKVVSTWGTQPSSTALALQVQTDRVVQFAGEYAYDKDFGSPVKGGEGWYRRGNYGGWPTGFVAAIYLRAEVGRRAEFGPGIGQINFAAQCDERSHNGGPPMQMRAQTKGSSILDEHQSNSDDMLRVVIFNQSYLCIYVSNNSVGVFQNSGYELAPMGSFGRMPWGDQ